MVDDEDTRTELKKIPTEEHDRLIANVNTYKCIINEQSRDLLKLRKDNLIKDFRHMEMVNLLKSFYTLQGKKRTY